MKTQNLDPEQTTLDDYKKQAIKMYGQDSGTPDLLKIAEEEMRKRGEL